MDFFVTKLIIFSRIFSIISVAFNHASAETLVCNFATGPWLYLAEPSYIAFVLNPQVFNVTQTTIDRVEGNHTVGHFNYDVRGIDISNATEMRKFPKNLDKFFTHLHLIGIFESGLNDIEQSDLKSFRQLRHLYLSHNKLTVIRANLFEFTPNLEVLSLYANDIFHIDARTFSDLSKLRMLYLRYNVCALGNARTRAEVLLLLDEIEAGNCTTDEFAIEQTESPIRRELLDAQNRMREAQNANIILADEVKQKALEVEGLVEKIRKLNETVKALESDKRRLKMRLDEVSRKSAGCADNAQAMREKDVEINTLKTKLHQQVIISKNLDAELHRRQRPN